MNVGDNIKRYRNKKGMTQSELGNLIGKKEITIRKYENGGIDPNIKILTNIAKALDVSVEKLIKNTDTINLTTADTETQFMFTEFLGSDPDFKNIKEAIEALGYNIYYNPTTQVVSIINKDKSAAAEIPEHDFVESGKVMLAHIKEFTQFEVSKFIDSLDFLYGISEKE